MNNQSSLSVPIELKAGIVQPAAVPITTKIRLLPEDTDAIVIDTAGELQCHDVVLVVYKARPNEFYIRQLGLGILPREMWPHKKNDGFRAMATFKSEKNADEFQGVKMEKIDALCKVCLWRDGDGQFHKLQGPSE